ncbi:MAG: hypothetical protein COV32_03460 [Candidatus Yonathbacteria bacterium CG10_big_fil_rev_8_21_14_0_10_43_136]|uniref:Uncharacterized protein n=2 Tax=Parcubacteria group TaxID=1794811 RepID=A0A2M7Q415_9BACT|nr:MAG: hypothetical protein AUK15_01195 [Candidatus Nomurabacteria bacterium CG2_30_43_9]PIQ36065.1 MAG: hypothetical protein COW60_00545 [Candidatus Yonathbacteria bacterium CG17_big_fil_post_rev_8_21_14_2_50_43_9]PIR40413.1 MAG: hypothetical protein COV32_03460 [Candidatus Yonathbacteria bacterium CG10_big_fil_rev_8_21_14_0_10_43_136]PIX57354.1 MAG: hypothetical protein COZ48_01115 [Candidatus Yonathbacteria bacterium CG_4_10_14_3_um_filter_43_12]PIY58171.1 MAG: hypothetical protein COY98_03
MDAFAKMDIFFLVTTVAIVVIAIFGTVLLYYILRTAKDVSEVIHIVRRESERFAKGAASARQKIKGRGESLLQKIIAFVQTFSTDKMKSKK